MLKKSMAIILALLMILSVVPVFAETLPSADGITLSRTSAYLTAGTTIQLTADEAVTWSTSSSAVATVSASGLVTAVATGTADITATTTDGKSAVCKVIVYEVDVRNHAATATPDINGGKFLTDLFGEENFEMMLTFDDNATDTTGNIHPTVKDNLTYENGFNGKAANFANGYLELSDAELGNGSITISTWLKPQSISTLPEPVISTSQVNPGKNEFTGFYMALLNSKVTFYMQRSPFEGNSSGFRYGYEQTMANLPEDIYDGWMNLTWVIDRTAWKVRCYIDYELVLETNLWSSLNPVWDGDWKPLLGRGKYTNGTSDIKYDGLMDDFFIYNGAMTQADMNKLKAYYGLVSTPVTGISLDKREITFDVNETAKLNASVAPSNATKKEIVWTSADPSVATVTDGVVTAVGAGSTTITATTVDGGFVASCLVNAKDPNLEDLKISRTSAYLSTGMTIQLTAEEAVTWLSDQSSIATVTEDGLVTAVARGEANIIARGTGGRSAVCKIVINDVDIRNHQSVPTPDVSGGSFLTDLFDKNKFKMMLTFDENATDVTGNLTTSVKDNLTYEDGFNGKAANFANGYVELPDAQLGNGSITFSTWLKPNSVSTLRSPIISTSQVNPGKYEYEGFYMALVNDKLEMYIHRRPYDGNATGFRKAYSALIGTHAPSDTYDGWVNVTWVADKTKYYMYCYVDYELVFSERIYSSSSPVWDGDWKPLIGRGKHTNGTSVLTYDGLMDDFFIYDGAMSAADLQKIKNYYQLNRAVPTDGITINKSSVALDINEAVSLTASVTPANATMKNVVWSTSNSSVATVNNGKVRGIGEGTATITATTVDGGFVASCTVEVSNVTEPFVYDRVCIFGVDGGGAWINADYMPNVQRIFNGGATTNTCQVSLPSVSTPGWTSILHGTSPDIHGRTNNYMGTKEPFPVDSPYPSVFRVLREADPNAKMAAFSYWPTMTKGVIETNIGVHTLIAETDAESNEKAIEYIQKNDPKILLVHYTDTDHMGHETGYGPNSEGHTEAMKKADALIGELYAAYEANGWLDSTLFITTADHGGVNINGVGNHGGSSPEEVNIFLGVQGPGVKQNSDIVDARYYDTAAIIAHALGLERPEGWIAKVPDGVFHGVHGQTRNEVLYQVSDYRDHVNTKAPSKEGEKITDIFGKEKFEFFLDFEGEAKDLTGNHQATVNKTVTFEEGYFGQSANFSQGSVLLDDCALGEEPITIGAWIKSDQIQPRSLLMASKPLSTEGDGFYLAASNEGLTFGARNGNIRNSFPPYFPYDVNEGWIHILIVVDNTTITQYTDFKLADGQSFDRANVPSGAFPIAIGSNPTGNHAPAFTANLDDVFIYRGAMTSEDVAKLAAYYSKEGTELNITDVQFGDAVSFDFGLEGDTTDSSIYAAIYDESNKLINVKTYPAQTAGGYAIKDTVGAKHLKVFVIDSDLAPKCAPATATKE